VPTQLSALTDETFPQDPEPMRSSCWTSGVSGAGRAVANCLGIALVAEGNAAIYQREGIVAVPVSGIPTSELALVWRHEDSSDAVRDFIDAATHPRPDDHR